MKGTKYYCYVFIAVGIYFSASKFIFDKVYETSQIVVDELFHIPQGISYCNGNFSYWDPKITTLPGLYLVSAALVGFYFPCNTYNLRFVNLVVSSFNFLLFSSILKFIYGYYNENRLKIVMQALNLAIFPPLYFFSHVYYTDTLSLMFLLLFSQLCVINKSKWLILIVGTWSVLMRQTNIVWVAMVLGHKLLDLLVRSSRVYGNKYLNKTIIGKRSLIARDIDPSKLKRYYGMLDLIIATKHHVSTYFINFFPFISISTWYVMIQQVAILVLFLVFLYHNGSIVVGDKSAHQMTIHLPQLLYFLLFYGVFALPYILTKLRSTLRLMLYNKINMLYFATIFAIIIHFNTIVHPYLLADNRHYTFYIWNRWFGKYDFAIYATIPVYIFLLFSVYDNLKDQNCISFLVPYCVSMFMVLVFQKLVEIRYFLVPFIIIRLRFIQPSYKIVISEFIWYSLINAVTFYLFFTKEIFWKDFKEPQRLIW